MRLLAIGGAVLVIGCASNETNQLTKDTTTSSASSTGGAGGASTTSSAGGAGGDTTTGVGGANTHPGWESGTRLRARVLTGEDGSRQFVGWYDSVLDANCFGQVASDGTRRCMPTPTASAIFFSDSGCTQRVAHVTKGCSVPDYVAIADTTSPCAPRYELRNLGASVSATAVYIGSPASCTGPTDQSAAYDMFDLGAVVSPSTLVEMTEMVE